ncbi:MAG: ABC transporter substrate-binding protein [Firmicutes bacterium]|nr:ABC transporter substrate-binding protein [Bacillota bacterium]
MTKKLLPLILTAVLLLAGCAGGGANTNTARENTGARKDKLQPVTVLLDWTPNTNHTGLYVALDKHWFADEGLQVNIIEPSQNSGATTQLVASGQAQFGVGFQEDVTQARANGVPVVSVAAVIQHNTSGFASLKDKGITRPLDMEGKRYGGESSPFEVATLKAIVEKDGGDFNKVKMINIGVTDFFTAVQRDVDFTWIYYGWTGVEAELRGMQLNYIELRRLEPALDYYTPVLITGEKLIADDPELVRKFLRATSKGYEFAIDHPEEAAGILLKHAPESNEKLLLASQAYLSPRYRDDAPRWGEQKAEVWKNYADWLYARNLLPQKIDTNQAFTNEFLPEQSKQ